MTEAAPLADAAARAAYAALLARSPQATLFHGLAYADAVCRVFGLRGELVLARGSDGAARVGGVVFWKRRGPFRLAVVPPLMPLSGPVVDTDLTDALAGSDPLAGADGRGGPLGAWIAHVARRADSAAFELPHAFSDSRPFAWAGWSVRARYTYAGPPEALLARPYVRQAVRESRAERADGSPRPGGLTVRWDDRAAALVGRFAEAPFRRREAAPAVGARAAEAMARGLVEAGSGRIAVAERSGAAVGAVAVLVGAGAGYVWAGAAEPGPGMLMLMHATAERLHADGVPEIDLVGANLPAVSAFKRRLGLPLVARARVEWTGSRLLRLREALRG